MKIAIFSESYEPVVNGVTVSILMLTRELKKLGHEIFVFAPGIKGHVDEENTTFRFPSIRPPQAKDYPLAVPYMPRLIRRLKRLDVDLIHTHTPFILGRLGLHASRRIGVPLVTTNHTQYIQYAHYFPLAPRAVTRKVIKGYMRWYYNQAASVVVPSSPIEEMLREYGVVTPIHVIPTGIALDVTEGRSARPSVRAKLGIPQDAFTLLYVGRLAREKNLEMLIRAFKRVAKKHKDARLMLVGEGPYESECREMVAKQGLGKQVVFVGPVLMTDVAKYYLAADLFVFASDSDTQGLVLWEALQAGLPCVAVRAGGAPEMLVDGEDSLLAANCPDDFAAKVDQLMCDPAMMSRCSENAVRNGARFHPREMASRMLEVYESVLHDR